MGQRKKLALYVHIVGDGTLSTLYGWGFPVMGRRKLGVLPGTGTQQARHKSLDPAYPPTGAVNGIKLKNSLKTPLNGDLSCTQKGRWFIRDSVGICVKFPQHTSGLILTGTAFVGTQQETYARTFLVRQ